MNKSIVCLPGDGIGPEVMQSAREVLQLLAEDYDWQLEIREALIGGAAIDATGQALPTETLAACKQADAVLLGAVGGPKWDDPKAKVRPEQGLLALRQGLGLYANLRPVRPMAGVRESSPIKENRLRGVDLLVVRELTGGMYFGRKQEGSEQASDECAYSAEEVRRVVRRAAKLAQSRRGRLTLVDKANVLATSRLWRRVAAEVVEQEFPDLQYETLLVDAAAMHLISRPAEFDVIVTENLFGDILTDEASMLAGSLGVLPSASLGDGGPGLYEPIHGSAPDIAGQDIANPAGMLLSVAMMLEQSLQHGESAERLCDAVEHVLSTGCLTADLGGAASTAEFTQAVCLALGENRHAEHAWSQRLWA
jgi:3-isopropylmalate dehydrogenase